MKIAILGWGSPVWDPRVLEIAASFEPTGPNLPVEFCRISKNHRLTLIIDETFGTLCQTYAAESGCSDLAAAIENLSQREKMANVSDVGFLDIKAQTRSPIATERHPHAIETIADWTLNNGYDATIWTALDGHFDQLAHEPFSVNAAMRFMESLEDHEPEAFARALDYIRRAPPAIQTPVREAVQAHWPANITI
jgi:hypothetical protein